MRILENGGTQLLGCLPPVFALTSVQKQLRVEQIYLSTILPEPCILVAVTRRKQVSNLFPLGEYVAGFLRYPDNPISRCCINQKIGHGNFVRGLLAAETTEGIQFGFGVPV